MKRSYVKPSVALINIATYQIIAASINERPGSWGSLYKKEETNSLGGKQNSNEWGNVWDK